MKFRGGGLNLLGRSVVATIEFAVNLGTSAVAVLPNITGSMATTLEPTFILCHELGIEN